MKLLQTVQTVKVRLRQPVSEDMAVGPLADAEIAKMRAVALRSSAAQAAAAGGEVLEYVVHSVEVIEVEG